MLSFGAILGAAAPITANVLAAQNTAQTALNDKRRQQAIENVILQRQADAATDAHQVAVAQAGNLSSEVAGRVATQNQLAKQQQAMSDHLPAYLNPDTPDEERSQHLAAIVSALGPSGASWLKDLNPNTQIINDAAGNAYTRQNNKLVRIPVADATPATTPSIPPAPPVTAPQPDLSAFSPSSNTFALNPKPQTPPTLPSTKLQFPPSSPSSSVVPVPPSLVPGAGKFGPAAQREADQAFQQAHPAPVTPYQEQELSLRRQQIENSTLKEFVDPQGVHHMATSVDARANGWLPLPKAAAGAGSSAPIAVRAGQMGLALRSAGDLFPLHDSLAKSGIPFGAEEAEKTATGQSMLSKLPFATELGNRALNSKSNGDYAQYNSILPNLLLASAHAISGARINQEQVKLLSQGLKLSPGDNDMTKAQKLTNLADFLNSMKASLPPQVAQQVEESIDPATKAILVKHGYGSPPTGYAYGEIKKVVPDFVPGAASTQPPAVDPGANTRTGSGHTPSTGSPVVAAPGVPGAKGPITLGASHVTPAERSALKAQGFTDAQIDAIKP